MKKKFFQFEPIGTVIGATLHSTPGDLVYELAATGSKPRDPGPPPKIPPPLVDVDPHSRSGVRLRWKPAPRDLEAMDTPADGY